MREVAPKKKKKIPKAGKEFWQFGRQDHKDRFCIYEESKIFQNYTMKIFQPLKIPVFVMNIHIHTIMFKT